MNRAPGPKAWRIAWITMPTCMLIAALVAACGSPTPAPVPVDEPRSIMADATGTPTPTSTPTTSGLGGQPRPSIQGRIGRSESGTAPCADLPTDLAAMTVALVIDDDGACEAPDQALIVVTPDASGAFAFPTEVGAGGPGPMPTPMRYCVRIERSTGARPDPVGPITPGLDPGTPFVLDDICVQP